MDGFALGKTKVFLKYYHVEYLSKLYEDQVRKIILVQACVRRWLARARYQKAKWEVASSVLTLQRFVRGWLTRKRLARLEQEERQNDLKKKKEAARQKAKKEKDGKKNEVKKEKTNWFKNKLMKRMSSQVWNFSN